jgi:hypothetical protein
MPVNAVRPIHKMRGGAQAHLIEADDGYFYVVKFLNNPQHRRILVNEWVAASFLHYLQISSPQTAMVRFTSGFIEDHPDVSIQLGNTRHPAAAGWHFGSRYPGNPATTAVYDFVPDTLLASTANAREFAGVLAFDKWTANADARQSIFIRARLKEYIPYYTEHSLRVGFIALMVDQGYVFNGPHWEYMDTPRNGLYFRPSVYAAIRGWDDFQPWLDRIVHFPEEVVDEALRQVPTEWLENDRDHLLRLLEQLMTRRSRVPDLIRDCIQGRVDPFPNWK